MLPFLTSLLLNVYLWIWLLSALFLWWVTRKNGVYRRWAFILLLGFWILGTGPVTESILWPLESRYQTPDIMSLEKKGVSQVVVLTGGGFPVRGEILSSAFPHGSIYRFLAGLELCTRLGPVCKIIFSGAAGRYNRGNMTGLTMQDLARILAPNRQILAEGHSGSTAEHPANVLPLVDHQPFVLVTSALHMPRSMRVFREAGLNPIAYPVDFLSLRNHGWMDWVPSIENLWKMSVAIREYQALALYSVRGWK